jgi:beta-lactamase superfamily II metal-dependent hydrolase
LLKSDRRTLLKSVMVLSLASVAPGFACAVSADSEPLPARREGEMDIHHIDTGCGNCTLVVTPDGTTIMIDAGAAAGMPETTSQPRPDGSRRAGEWQARYALRYAGKPQLDYFVATHVHPDHVGDVGERNPIDASGAFRLTGVSDVDRLMPIGTVIDRGFPGYAAALPDAPYAHNYVAYLKRREATGRAVQAAVVGSEEQLRGAAWKTRILAANGIVWGAKSAPAGAERLTENDLCIALRFTYGKFSYFAGGDLNSDTHDGREPQLDIETPAARAAGRTEVAAANHHGYFDACGPEFVRSLDAQVYVIQAWDVGHPGTAQVQRMLGAWSQTAAHDVFATDILPANELTNRRFIPLLKSRRGHVVVRVASGGESYRIFVLDSSRENGDITGAFGPYQCRTNSTGT